MVIVHQARIATRGSLNTARLHMLVKDVDDANDRLDPRRRGLTKGSQVNKQETCLEK